MTWSLSSVCISKALFVLFVLLISNAITVVLVTQWLTTDIRHRPTTFAQNRKSSRNRIDSILPWIFVITPTHSRLEQKADLTRLAQTLRLVPYVHWIVVEDAVNRTKGIQDWLIGTGVKHTYLYHYKNVKEEKKRNVKGTSMKGWRPRAYAIDWLRKDHQKKKPHIKGVIYFADDDNSYDERLFNNFIRNVRRVGVWAVGLVGGALVEAPIVQNSTVVAFNVVWGKKRKFPLDMAAFAVNLDLILKSNVNFNKNCEKRTTLEVCFLDQLNVTWSDLEPFGLAEGKKQVFVWHTKTKSSGSKGGNHGFDV